MDWNLIIGFVGSTIAIIAFVYGSLLNFKSDINSHIDRLERRVDLFENKMTSLEERMFYMATGKRLEDAILEERMKHPKTDP